jgi:hypothetical protein
MISNRTRTNNYRRLFTTTDNDAFTIDKVAVTAYVDKMRKAAFSEIDKAISIYTTQPTGEFVFFPIWEEIYRNILEYDDERTQQTIIVLEQKLISALKQFEFDGDEVSYAESVAIEITQNYPLRFLGDVSQRIYLKYNDDPRILIGLCRCLERFDESEVMPWGLTMLMGLVNHKDDSIKEVAVMLIENWATVSLLPALRNIEVKHDWLRAYIDDVIMCLDKRGQKCTI